MPNATAMSGRIRSSMATKLTLLLELAIVYISPKITAGTCPILKVVKMVGIPHNYVMSNNFRDKFGKSMTVDTCWKILENAYRCSWRVANKSKREQIYQ